jgi:flagellar biogenesis protein FliO
MKVLELEKMRQNNQNEDARTARVGGLVGWMLNRLRVRGSRRPQRLTLLERIALAPRQSLALVEAEGRRFLVATSPEGAPAFYALDEPLIPAPTSQARPAQARVSW